MFKNAFGFLQKIGKALMLPVAVLPAAGILLGVGSSDFAFIPEVVNDVIYDCVQFHGGLGYMRETPVERMSRDARILPIGGGATEVMLEEVAKRM